MQRTEIDRFMQEGDTFPFDALWDGAKQTVKMDYIARRFGQEDNFTQVDVENHRIVTTNYDKRGNRLGRNTLKLG